MKTIKLGEITTNLDKKRIPLNSTQRLEKSKQKIYPYIGANNILTYIDEYIFNEEILCVAEDGGSWGAYEVCSNIYNEKCWVNNHAHVLVAKTGTYLDYLRHYLNYSNLNRYITGATRGKLTRKYLDTIKISIPKSFSNQIRIATLLSRIEALIATRKNNLNLLDEFLKSTFLEMFGDPIRNEKGWTKDEISQFGTVSTGNTPPRKDEENFNQKYIEWIKTDNITDDLLYLTNAREYLSEKGAKKGRVLTKGAILVACIAGSINSIGRVALSDRDVAFNQQINAIQPYDDIDPIFLYWLFRVAKKYIQSHSSKGMKKIITKGVFNKILLIRPSFELQKKFSKIALKADLLKNLYQQNLNDLENLYGSVSQKAFKGELDLSHIPLPKVKPEAERKPEEFSTDTTPVYAKATPDNRAKTEPVFFKTDKKEEQLFCSIFNKYLNSHKGKTFTFDDYFFYWAQHEEVDDNILGLAEYELTKKWLYQLIKDGSIQQEFGADKNQLVLKLKR